MGRARQFAAAASSVPPRADRPTARSAARRFVVLRSSAFRPAHSGSPLTPSYPRPTRARDQGAASTQNFGYRRTPRGSEVTVTHAAEEGTVTRAHHLLVSSGWLPREPGSPHPGCVGSGASPAASALPGTARNTPFAGRAAPAGGTRDSAILPKGRASPYVRFLGPLPAPVESLTWGLDARRGL
jgi:hypothetical protein